MGGCSEGVGRTESDHLLFGCKPRIRLNTNQSIRQSTPTFRHGKQKTGSRKHPTETQTHIIILDLTVLLFFIHTRTLTAKGLQRPTMTVKGYQSHLSILQRCRLVCGHEGSSHLSPVLALWFFMQVHISYNYLCSSLYREWINRVRLPNYDRGQL